MNKLYSFLGLIQKAGKLSSGDDTVELDIKKNMVKLLIISEDASENTKKKFEHMASSRKINFVFFGNKYDLGAAIGKSPRSILAIKDSGFAKAFTDKASNIINGGECIVKG
ncbi:L7Ae/L30e/S12e/Gadd45 family ribosomal protein [Clostridium cylindrosporum]|uniref:Ribosomal L7Ae/L30e/S12e/gadd45 family protein n=1 Tax=Clostridium cylindrosporum DSM 605 TaxID=1121307 RepID=A0A0J8DAK8_CLOCY|nr:ribosomal L7Ae/L30e/S12e/Gadd45 family protein [Clostridium cylindrosporum]KMT23065.1 ribosomal L7Ae/L30e/S12e/gadd45 family protein [Clostridium cylindrosporum DSM 605]